MYIHIKRTYVYTYKRIPTHSERRGVFSDGGGGVRSIHARNTHVLTHRTTYIHTRTHINTNRTHIYRTTFFIHKNLATSRKSSCAGGLRNSSESTNGRCKEENKKKEQNDNDDNKKGK